MKRFLMIVCCFFMLVGGYLCGLLSVAYLSAQANATSYESRHVWHQAAQQLSIHENAVPQSPMFSSWISLFTKFSNNSKNKHNSYYELLPPAFGHVLFFDYVLYQKLIKPFHKADVTQSTSIYLLNCAFLI